MTTPLLFALLPTASADVVVVVEVGPEGAALVDAVDLGRPASPGPLAGPSVGLVEVLDAEGRVLLRADVPDPRARSVIFPEGGGRSHTLERARARVSVAWPPEAAAVRVGERALRPRLPPPSAATPILDNGPPEERLDLLLLGDGYTADELDRFAADVDRLTAHLLSVEPFVAYDGLFNVWRVDAPSNESGASHHEDDPRLLRDTRYGCYYGCGGIERLVCCDDARVLADVEANLPDADGVVVLINDPEYGGAGGFTYATSYTADPWGAQVFAHELGHSLIGLWDEYSYGTTGSGVGPNCGAASDGSAWSQWLDEPGVGAWPTCSFTTLYRPTDQSCMMNSLQDQYCPVCREHVVLGIYRHLPGLIVETTPPAGELALTEATRLSAEVLAPDLLTWRWELDGQTLGEETTLDLAACGPSGELSLTVFDPTPWVRLDEAGFLEDGVKWQLTRAPCPADSLGLDSGEDGVGPGKDGQGCGCAQGRAPGPGVIWAAILAILARRRLR